MALCVVKAPLVSYLASLISYLLSLVDLSFKPADFWFSSAAFAAPSGCRGGPVSARQQWHEPPGGGGLEGQGGLPGRTARHRERCRDP